MIEVPRSTDFDGRSYLSHVALGPCRTVLVRSLRSDFPHEHTAQAQALNIRDALQHRYISEQTKRTIYGYTLSSSLPLPLQLQSRRVRLHCILTINKYLKRICAGSYTIYYSSSSASSALSFQNEWGARTHLVVLQVHLRVIHVLPGTLRHLTPTQLGVVERRACVLPRARLSAPEAECRSVQCIARLASSRDHTEGGGEEEAKWRGERIHTVGPVSCSFGGI